MIARRHFAPAIALLSGAVASDPSDARAWSLLGQCYTEAGHQTSAIAALMRAVILDDESGATCEALGVAWLRRGDIDTARSWFHRGLRALERSSDRDARAQRGSIMRNIAMALVMERRQREARFLLEEAIEESPDDLLTLHALSAQYINDGRYVDAAPLVDRILEQPELPDWIRESAEQGREIIRTRS
tara:strand:+ start:580 stop:1143 length:564 start_codon:yes stop_codon:yes gene_type:complete